MEKSSNVTFFRQIAFQNLQRKSLGFSETENNSAELKRTCKIKYLPVVQADGKEITRYTSYIMRYVKQKTIGLSGIKSDINSCVVTDI